MKLACVIGGICVHGPENACAVLNSPGFRPVPCADSKKCRMESHASSSFPKKLLGRGKSHLERKTKSSYIPPGDECPQACPVHGVGLCQSLACSLSGQCPELVLELVSMSWVSLQDTDCGRTPPERGEGRLTLSSKRKRVYSDTTQDWLWSGNIDLDFCKYWVSTW